MRYHIGTAARLILAAIFVATVQTVAVQVGDLAPDNGVLATLSGSAILIAYFAFVVYVAVNVIMERIIDPLTKEK